MYLKALEIQGFKSFPDKTRLTFEKDITAIVGPNGSGKSNICDAIAWVMGEQRSKALRGAKMEDVIFGGTEKRKALGYAQVSLIIDNSAHIFDRDRPEIVLTRRFYRSGESEYYIDREAVRLKDIHSLLMDTGLGRDGYSIIGQGRIAEIVSSKSTDRREVFEEAAGISRYRYRKEEAERKLEKTGDDLLRINDKIEELELQVGPLKQQSETAKRYLILRDELRVMEISAWMCRLEKIHAQTETVRQAHEQLSSTLEQARADLEALYASSGSITERMHRKDVESEQARERLAQQESLAAQLGSQIAVLQANVESSTQAKERMLRDITEQQDRVSELGSRIQEGKERLAQIAEELTALQRQTAQCQNVLDGCRMKIRGREEAVQQLTDRLNALSVERRSVDGRIGMLAEMQREYEGYPRAVKTVMRESERGSLRGVHGPVADLLRADEEHALAIETALGAASQDIVVDTQDVGRYAIEMLKRTDAGRATFLPLDTIRGSVMRDAPVNDPGFVGVASDLVRYDRRYEQIVLSLLGRTVIAETLADAVRMSRASASRLRIVTLDGQMIHAGGFMTGGSSARTSGALSRANELDRLKKKRKELESSEKCMVADLDRAKSELASVRYQLDMAQEDQNKLRTRVSALEAEQRATESSVQQLQALLATLTGDSETRRQAVESSEEQIRGYRARLAEDEAKLDEVPSHGVPGFLHGAQRSQGRRGCGRSCPAVLDRQRRGQLQRPAEFRVPGFLRDFPKGDAGPV